MEADLTEQQKTNSLAGETVSLTGTLASLTRADAVALIEVHGGEYRPRVGPETTLVVVGNQRMPLRKNGTVTANFGRVLKLQKSGQEIDLLTEDEFLHRKPREPVAEIVFLSLVFHRAGAKHGVRHAVH